MSDEKRSIGVFDSGVGGLTVVRELRRLMPNESIIYFGDTERAPYGGKNAETLISHGREIINFLLKKKCKMVVMACGTSSSASYDVLRAEFPNVPIVDTIRPAAAAVAELAHKTPNFAPVFIATSATVKSGLFEKIFREETRGAEIISRACPLFAPMVEAGLASEENHPLVKFAAENYLADLRGKVNALIFGCTHYPLLQNALSQVLGEILFINPATATAEAAKKILPSIDSSPSEITFYTSGNAKIFSQIAKNILNESCKAIKTEL
jgi:glutamate racemase